MGSDHSTAAAGTKPPRSGHHRSSPSGSSVSSGDIPYTFYAVGRPIGDSPKHQSKRRGAHDSPHKTKDRNLPKNIVVVKEGVQQTPSPQTDPDLLRLQELPTFLPIMRGALNVASTRDVDVFDKLDYRQVLLLCMRYQEHLKKCADVVQADQNIISNRIRDIDFAITALTNMLTDRQKKYAKYADKVNKVHDIAATLNKTQRNMEQSMILMKELNSILPAEERLEPFFVQPPEGGTIIDAVAAGRRSSDHSLSSN